MLDNEVFRCEVGVGEEAVGSADFEMAMYDHGGVLLAQSQPVYAVVIDSEDAAVLLKQRDVLMANAIRFDRDRQQYIMYVIGRDTLGI